MLTQILTSTLTPALKTSALIKGVVQGNTFTYGRSDGKPWVWSDPEVAPVRDEWLKYVNLTTIDFEVTQSQFSDPNIINFNMTINYTNQSALDIQDSIDLYTGAGQGLIFFISAGLNPNDLIYPGYTNFTWTINETRIDPDWGGRQICALNYTTIKPDPSTKMLTYATSVIYWDRLTGVLLSVYESKAQYSGGPYAVGGGVFYELVSNNIGLPKPQHDTPVDTTLIIVIIAAILIAAFIIVIVRMSKTAPKKKWKRLKE